MQGPRQAAAMCAGVDVKGHSEAVTEPVFPDKRLGDESVLGSGKAHAQYCVMWRCRGNGGNASWHQQVGGRHDIEQWQLQRRDMATGLDRVAVVQPSCVVRWQVWPCRGIDSCAVRGACTAPRAAHAAAHLSHAYPVVQWGVSRVVLRSISAACMFSCASHIFVAGQPPQCWRRTPLCCSFTAGCCARTHAVLQQRFCIETLTAFRWPARTASAGMLQSRLRPRHTTSLRRCQCARHGDVLREGPRCRSR